MTAGGPAYYRVLAPSPLHTDPIEIEADDVIEATGATYHTGCAMAYLWRAGRKEGAAYEADIEKAVRHLERELWRVRCGEGHP